MSNKQIRRYLRQVSNKLPYSGKKRKQIIEDLNRNIKNYVLTAPDATMQDIIKHFGSPETIALSGFEQTEINDLLKKMRVRKSVVRLVAGIAVLGVLIWGGVVGWAAYKEWSNTNGYTVDYLDDDIVNITYD